MTSKRNPTNSRRRNHKNFLPPRSVFTWKWIIIMYFVGILPMASGLSIATILALIVCLGWCYYRQKSGKVHVTKSWELQ